MLKDLLARLRENLTPGAALPPDEARIAVAALLVGVARVDGNYQEAERALIDRLLGARFGLTAPAAAALRADGETAETAASDVFRFTHLVKESVPYEERGALLEALWRVALSDRIREEHEDALMRKLTDLLGLSSRDSAEARQRAGSAPV